MVTKTFLFEKDGYSIYKLNVMGAFFFIVTEIKSGKRYIRKTLSVVNVIIESKKD